MCGLGYHLISKCVWAHYYSPCAAYAICLITFRSPLYIAVTDHTVKHAHISSLLVVCLCVASSFVILSVCSFVSFLYTSPHFLSLLSPLSLSSSLLLLSLSLQFPLILPFFLFLCVSCFLSTSALSFSISLQKEKNILSLPGKKSGWMGNNNWDAV